jgi:hypothetical protein
MEKEMRYGMLMMYETMNKWLVAQDIKQVKAIITRVRKFNIRKTSKNKCEIGLKNHYQCKA